MADAPETPAVSPNLQNWLTQGEQLYASAVNEFRALEAQLDDLEQKLAAKQAEVNRIAQIIGKPEIEGFRRLTAELTSVSESDGRMERMPVPHVAATVVSPSNSNNATIARALTGRFGR
jgi:hypothetical protein